MKTESKPLPHDVSTLQRLLLAEREKNRLLQEQIEALLAQFRLAQQRHFGKSSEKQPQVFNEAEQLVEQTDEAAPAPAPKQPKRQPLPSHLPREVRQHDLDPQQKACDVCGCALHAMGETRSEQLEFVPAHIKVIEHRRRKYACRQCEKTGTQSHIKLAKLPLTAIPKSIATPSLLSQIITSKYQYSLPLYRQEQLFQQHGIHLGRNTMSQWVLRSAELVKPLVDAWKQPLLQQPVIHADETRVTVINAAQAHHIMWLYCSGAPLPSRQGSPQVILFDHQPNRAGDRAVDFLQGYQGYLQVDGPCVST